LKVEKRNPTYGIRFIFSRMRTIERDPSGFFIVLIEKYHQESLYGELAQTLNERKQN